MTIPTLILFLQTYAKLIGVAAAVIIFGSWIVENTFARRAKDLKDAILQAEADKLSAERFHHVESKLLEVYQVAASARGYSAETRSEGHRTFKDELHSDVELLERAGVTREFVHAISRFCSRSDEFIAAIDPPEEIARGVRETVRALDELQDQIDARHEEYRKRQQPIAGEVINPNTITEDQAKQLGVVIRELRDEIEFTLAPRLTPIANSMFRAYDSLFAHARLELTRREKRAKVASFIQISLFVVGSLLALVSSYFEATAPKP